MCWSAKILAFSRQMPGDPSSRWNCTSKRGESCEGVAEILSTLPAFFTALTHRAVDGEWVNNHWLPRVFRAGRRTAGPLRVHRGTRRRADGRWQGAMNPGTNVTF